MYEEFHVQIHQAEEGGFWAEVAELPGCVSQGETLEEVQKNIQEAIAGCLDTDITDVEWETVTRPRTRNSRRVHA